jgi:hypothetical protein
MSSQLTQRTFGLSVFAVSSALRGIRESSIAAAEPELIRRNCRLSISFVQPAINAASKLYKFLLIMDK